MSKKTQGIWLITGIIFVLSIITGCTTIPILNIEYRLPQPLNGLAGKKVYLAFEDKRDPKELFSKGARLEFGNGPENISFYLAKGTDKAFKMGIYEVPTLFQEAFKRRFSNLGMEVVERGQQAPIGIVIVLKRFYLDSQGKDWKAYIEYEGRLLKDNNELSRQNINGEGSRIRLIGYVQANILMSELFTDLVNKLDINRLFQQANLN